MKNFFKQIIIAIITWQARLVLRKYNPKIIAIIGSVGKTSTKDAIFTVLSKFKKVRKSEKSFNNEIGVPLTILGLPSAESNFFMWFENIFFGFFILIFKRDYPEYLILEVGVGKPGDMKKHVAPWLHPDILVVTRFPEKPVHVEFFNSVDSLIEEKSALVFSVKKDGLLVLNHDDEKVYNLHSKSNCRCVSYGENENATYRFTYPSYLNEKDIVKGISFKLLYNGNTFPVILPNVVGLHSVSESIIAIICANEIGCDLLQSINSISEYRTPKSRLSIIEGLNDSILIDDTYNSSPIALEKALGVLNNLKGKRKIAVLGDMMELGKFTKEEHEKIGEIIVPIADILVTVGVRARFIAESAIENKFPQKEIYIFDSSKTAAKFLEGIIEKGDLVLIKGSQAIRLERVVVSIMANQDLKYDLVCRQEKEWRDKE